MKTKSLNTVKCHDCPCTITEYRDVYTIRGKLKKLGWTRPSVVEGKFLRFVDRCGACSTDDQHKTAQCAMEPPPQFTKDMSLEDMTSPWAIQ